MDVDWDALPPEAQEAILDGGAGEPPEGVEQRLGNPEKNNVTALVVLGISLFIIGVVFFIRVYAKVFVVKKLRVEDCKKSPFLNTPAKASFASTMLTISLVFGLMAFVSLGITCGKFPFLFPHPAVLRYPSKTLRILIVNW